MNTKQLQLVTFGQAKSLKALGFDWVDCSETTGLSPIAYMEVIQDNRPTVALALKWIRDEKRIPCSVEFNGCVYEGCYAIKEFPPKLHWVSGDDTYDTYEAAESELLDELIKLLERRRNEI